MPAQYLVASDLGSQSVKTAIYDTDGRIIGSCKQATKIHTIGPDALVYDGDEFYHLTTENIRSLVRQAGVRPTDIAAISFSGMGGGIIGIDESWNATSEYTNPIDCRDHSCFAAVVQEYGDLIRAKSATGSPMAANKLVWLKRTASDVYQRSRKFMIVTQYVQGKMAGLRAEDSFWEITSSGFSGLVDLQKMEWSQEILHALELDGSKLPRLVRPTDLVGTLSQASAVDCGLVSGIPIAAGAYDKPCDALGSGSTVVGSAVDNAATYPAITVCVDQFISDLKYQRLESHPSAIDGIWMLEAYITGGGLTHKWFCENFCTGQKSCTDEVMTHTFGMMDNEAARIPPGADGLLFVPHLRGRATPCEPDARGLWVGFTWSHNKAHFYRAMLESVAYEHACSLQIAREYFPKVQFNRVTVLGGGAESRFWNQLKADVVGMPYARLDREDCATLGAAIIGGKAVGLFADMQATAERFSKVRETYVPNASFHARYSRYVEAYAALFRELKPTFTRLSELRQLSG